MKSALSIIAIVLAFVAYVPYIRDILQNKTKPHVYSWFVWGLLGAIIFALQVKGGGGFGAYITLSAVIITFIVFLLGLRNGKKDITTADTIFFIAALVSIGLWVLAKQPVLSVILLVTIDMLAFIPTVRKSWHKPNEETLFTWGLNSFRYCLAILALSHYNTLTLLYPVAWTFGNILLTGLLFTRRKRIDTLTPTP
jgi:hypothetical protein